LDEKTAVFNHNRVCDRESLVGGTLMATMVARISGIATILLFSSISLLVAQDARSVTKSHQRRNPQMATVFITGRVLNEHGKPLPELTQVNLVCNGRIRQQTLTAPDGSFAIEIGGPRNEDWMDPSMGGSSNGALESTVKMRTGEGGALDEVPSMGRGRVSLVGCEVGVPPEPGVASDVINLGNRSAYEDPDIGVIIVRELSAKAATTVSVNSLSAPDDARKAYERADKELREENPKLEEAVKDLEKAIDEYPEYSAAWDLLARIQLGQGRTEEGRKSFQRALEEEPNFISPQLGLAQLAVRQTNWNETLKWTGGVLKLDSNHPQALYWDGLAHYYLNQFDQAETSLSNLYRQGHFQRFPFGLLLVGVIHANQGKIPAAATELERYLRYMPSDKVSAGQRSGLERQLAEWRSEGLLPIRPASVSESPDNLSPEE
jgi:hypothetical protein